VKLSDQKSVCTLSSTFANFTHWSEPRRLTYQEWKRLGSFPDDYQAKTDKIGKYMIGMSVPPKMTEQVARAVIDQWLLPKEE
jgi:site-specific DNA-cytosine methylase